MNTLQTRARPQTMKDTKFRTYAYKAGKALCEHIGHDSIFAQSNLDQDMETIQNNTASAACSYYQTMKKRRNAILKKKKKIDGNVKQFAAIRDDHCHLPFLLAGFALVYEYFIPFEFIENAFDSIDVKIAHLALKSGKNPNFPSKNKTNLKTERGVTPKGSRRENKYISDINKLCIYSNARFRSENPEMPETVVFDIVFRNYTMKAFENTAIRWFNENMSNLVGLSRAEVLLRAREFTRNPAFKEYMPQSHKDQEMRIRCHKEVGTLARNFCKSMFTAEAHTFVKTEMEADKTSVKTYHTHARKLIDLGMFPTETGDIKTENQSDEKDESVCGEGGEHSGEASIPCLQASNPAMTHSQTSGAEEVSAEITADIGTRPGIAQLSFTTQDDFEIHTQDDFKIHTQDVQIQLSKQFRFSFEPSLI